MDTPDTKAQIKSGPARRWRFGSVEFDERVWELRIDGHVVEVERKPLEVLRFLLHNPDRLVTKEEILEAVWPRRILSESVLTKCIARLREALKDERQEVIRTVYGQGYRLVAPVSVELLPTGTRAGAGEVFSPKRWKRPWILAPLGAVALALAAVLLAPWGKREDGGPGSVADAEKSVAVLPFENLSAEPESRYFTDGLHGSVITHLAHMQDLRVIAQTSVLPYRDRTGDLRTVARELNVAHVVEGNVQKAGNRLRVSARLIRLSDAANIWAAEYDRGVSDVFAIQGDIARQIALAVQGRLRPPEQVTIERIPTRSPEAYELYLQALVSHQQLTPPDRPRFDQAIARLERAVRLDPQFAQAHALLALVHDNMYWSGLDPSPERRARMHAAADTALRIDPELADGHIAKGVALYHGGRDYDGAINALERARRLAPGDARVHFWAGVIYRRQGRWKETVAALEQAALLDPRNKPVLMELAATLRQLRRYAAADGVFQRLLEFAPEDPRVLLIGTRNHFHWRGDLGPTERVLAAIPSEMDAGCIIPEIRFRVLTMQRRYQEAATALLTCDEDYVSGPAERFPKALGIGLAYWLDGDREAARRYAEPARLRMEAMLGADPDLAWTRMALGYAYTILGDAEAARRHVEAALKIMPVSRDALFGANLIGEAAVIYAMLGDTENALDRLALALSLPGDWNPHRARLEPLFDSIREHPRFQALTDPSTAFQF